MNDSSNIKGKAMYYKVTITETGKEQFSKEGYSTFNREAKTFSTKEEAVDFISERYSGHKRERMYIDGPDGQAIQIGWIVCYVNKDWSHNSAPWTQQDWVELTEVTETPIVW